MNSAQIRKQFLDFFESKGHEIVPSAPMVIKNDPTLMFTNAGMNQFKDIFLGISPAKYNRVADSQKCLRVSGKHNDLEEVGVDTYHHTMFEMLGNWSFGDYFKKEAIACAWELLTEVYKIPKDRLYVTVFEGDASEKLEFDSESFDIWKSFIDESRIINGNKKDNFWEMGDTGPCGPCTEIHVDMRSDEDRKSIDGKAFVNADHPQVIEIWNNVFMEFNRKADGSLESLPAKHVDTGMGFERLCMVLQNKQSTYDTDVFQPLIKALEEKSSKSYGVDIQTDIAMRVISDHIRTIAFAIADGQLPESNKAGYVIRRILRRAVRYGYTFLGFNEPFMFSLVDSLIKVMGEAFPEIVSQKSLIINVIQEEENSFLRTLANGINRFNDYTKKNKGKEVIDGLFAFELYDTYGFPIDLTQLIAREQNLTVDMPSFELELQKQKERSRSSTAIAAGDWNVIEEDDRQEFIGYSYTEADVRITKYREVSAKGKKQIHLLFNLTPFYAESGGQVGDTGIIKSAADQIRILDTKKEHGQIIHFADKLPTDPKATFNAQVDLDRRKAIMANHSATHLLHSALREVLGSHVEQKGSLVAPDHLRFDFSHFSKIESDDLSRIEGMVNEKILENIESSIVEMPLEEARKLGAMALFGEKYGDVVRVVSIDPSYSVELCGGTHVKATGAIGYFKILSESAVAAGVRRIEAISSKTAGKYISEELELINQVKGVLKTGKDIIKGIHNLQEENSFLTRQIEQFRKEKAGAIKKDLIASIIDEAGIKKLISKVDLDHPDVIKTLAFELKQQFSDAFIVLINEANGKPMIAVALGDNLVKAGWNAVNIIKKLSPIIQGGGGGQPFFATAGGKNLDGMDKVLIEAKNINSPI
ncbi:MAG: alanine--tRNA ligase [Bacteroidia bacterium]